LKHNNKQLSGVGQVTSIKPFLPAVRPLMRELYNYFPKIYNDPATEKAQIAIDMSLAANQI
jgi:hypothetical protein